MTWEEAVKELRSNPANHQSILETTLMKISLLRLNAFFKAMSLMRLLNCFHPMLKHFWI